MCNGCWFGDGNCGGSSTTAYALAPVGGYADGRTGSPGSTITREEARISVDYCAEKMMDSPECSTEFIGVAHTNGHCWCAKKGGACNVGTDIHDLGDTSKGYFFQRKL